MKHLPILPLIIAVLFVAGCKSTTNEEPTQEDLEKERLFGLMDNWYLWNQTLPDNPDLSSFENSTEIVNRLRYSALDRWSSVGVAATFNSYYNEGTYFGYGFSYGYNEDNELKIRYVFDDSPFGKAGVERGWTFTAIDGQNTQTITDWSNVFGENTPGFTQQFTFKNLAGETKELSITKDVVTMNTVLHSDTLSIGSKTIGYLVFNNFIEPSRSELDAAFDLFERSAVDKIILDLRYNGGGRISVATYLANYLIGQQNNGQFLYRFVHNDDKTENNSGQTLRKQGSLSIDELIILTTEATASASELLLNGLQPLMNVTHIGTSNTYGKPVGSYSWYSLDETQVYTLISFKVINKQGDGEYFDGIEPDFTACDDLSASWGERDESMLSAAIEYLETGNTGGCSVQTKTMLKTLQLPNEAYIPSAIFEWN